MRVDSSAPRPALGGQAHAHPGKNPESDRTTATRGLCFRSDHVECGDSPFIPGLKILPLFSHPVTSISRTARVGRELEPVVSIAFPGRSRQSPGRRRNTCPGASLARGRRAPSGAYSACARRAARIPVVEMCDGQPRQVREASWRMTAAGWPRLRVARRLGGWRT